MIDTQKEDWAATALKSTFFGEPIENLTRVELLAVIGHLIQERANDAKLYKSSMEIASLARLRLTDAEREAVEIAIQWLEPDSQVADELRELLERLK